MRLLRVIALVVLSASILGCSLLMGSTPSFKTGTPKPPVIGAAEIDRPVLRSEFYRALGAGEGLTGIRLVEIYRRNQELASSTPEYRIFGVRSGSVYDLLGLENADVLVAAHGLVIPIGSVFPEYVKLLELERESSIEIRRLGEPKLLKIRFIEDAPRRGVVATAPIAVQPEGAIVSKEDVERAAVKAEPDGAASPSKELSSGGDGVGGESAQVSAVETEASSNVPQAIQEPN